MSDKALDLVIKELADYLGSCPYDSYGWERSEGCEGNCEKDGFKPKDCYKKYYLAKADETEERQDNG